ncbi:MAG: 4Fe-4S binding protein [Nanoarchaeota archaeon]|nr:4Fe-4S binding protein [Nanoarchaeota archaeon]
MVKPNVDCKKCKRHFTCVSVCPVGVFDKTDKGCVKVARPKDCIGCGACEANCPEQAIVVK